MSLTIESSNMTITGSFFLSDVSLSVLSLESCMFSIAVLVVLCFAITFSFGESVLLLREVIQFLSFRYQLGSPQFLMVNGNFWFLSAILV